MTIEEFKDEIALEAKVNPDSIYVLGWQRDLCTWEAGLPPGEDASWSDEVLCGSTSDAGPADDALKDSAGGD